MRALVPLCMRAVCSKIGHWYCFAEHNRRTISLLDTTLSASMDSLERGKSRQKHIGQQSTQCKRLSDHPIKTGGIGTIWDLLGVQATGLSLPRWRILSPRNSSKLKWPLVIQRRQQVVCRGGFALSGYTFGCMGSIPPAISDDSAPRRSQRVMLKVSVVVLARGADNKPVSEETRTITVNAHGAMILLSLKVSIGQSIMLRNLRTGEEVSCRVVCLNPYQLEKREVGVEFISLFLVSGAFPFLQLIGQREAPKRKAAQAARVACGQIQKRRNEIRSRLERRPELDC